MRMNRPVVRAQYTAPFTGIMMKGKNKTMEMIDIEKPKSLLVRAPVMDDLQAVYDVIHAAGLADNGREGMMLEDLQLGWQEATFNLATDAWVVVTPESRIVAYADTGERNYIKLYGYIRVHPDYRGMEIEQYLLHLIEARMQQHIPLAPAHARVTLAFGISHNNQGDAALLKQEGYDYIRSFYDMEIDLKEAPQSPEWPTGLTVRTMRPGEERAVFELIEEAFSDHWGHLPGKYEDWEHWAIKRESFDPSLWFLVFDGDELAAGALCLYEPSTEVGWVGQLAVRRPWRRKGLGMALLQQAYAEFYRRGVYKVMLGVDAQNLTGALRLYERAGMHVAIQTDSYQKELRAGEELSTQTLSD
jgi:mycothiol synthase